MKDLNSFYPVVSATNPNALLAFFVEQMQFKPVYTSDWYWHLSLNQRPDVNIAIVDCQHESIPEGFRTPVQGLLLNFEMPDITTYYQKVAQDWKILLPLRDEDWGQRHFIAGTPEPGLMLDLIELIPPSEEFLKNYEHEAEPA